MWTREQKELFEKDHKLLRMIYGALLLSVLFYGGLALLLPKSTAVSGAALAPDFQLKIFYGIGALLVFVIFVVHRRFLPKPIELDRTNSELNRILLKNRMGHLIIWSCSEAVGISGLLLLLLTGKNGEAWQFLGVAFLLMLLFYPRRIQ
jgi:hypothetical protein